MGTDHDIFVYALQQVRYWYRYIVVCPLILLRARVAFIVGNAQYGGVTIPAKMFSL